MLKIVGWVLCSATGIWIVLFLLGAFRGFRKSVLATHKHRESSSFQSSASIQPDPTLGDNALAFKSWTDVWFQRAPKVDTFDPVVVSTSIEGIIRAILADDDAKAQQFSDQIPVSDDWASEKLVLYYQEQFMPSFSVFDKSHFKKEQFASSFNAALDNQNPLSAMHVMVQTLFWQTWYCLKKARTIFDQQKAMNYHFKNFSGGAIMLKAMMHRK